MIINKVTFAEACNKLLSLYYCVFFDEGFWCTFLFKNLIIEIEAALQ